MIIRANILKKYARYIGIRTFSSDYNGKANMWRKHIGFVLFQVWFGK